MILELPKDFSLYKSETRYAIVKDDCLYIKGVMNFDELMYSLTYAKKGKSKCCYCLKHVSEGKITLDHMFPRYYGGVSVTNNLIPSCLNCNSEKGILTLREYKIFRKIKSKEQKHSFREVIADKNEEIRYKNGFILPKDWIKYVSIEDIFLRTLFDENDCKNGPKHKRYMNFIETYHQLPKPVVISSNNVLLDGYITIMCAIECNYTKIPVIQLENVVVI